MLVVTLLVGAALATAALLQRVLDDAGSRASADTTGVRERTGLATASTPRATTLRAVDADGPGGSDQDPAAVTFETRIPLDPLVAIVVAIGLGMPAVRPPAASGARGPPAARST